MNKALQGLLKTLAGVASGLSPVAKAIVAALLPLASAVLNMALAGSFNVPTIISLATSAAAALLVYFVPNGTKRAKPVPPVA